MDCTIEVVLFDLGGVLFDFQGMDAIKSLAGIEDVEEVRRRWLASSWIRAFERGACSPREFARGVVREWGLLLGPDEFLEAFKSWLGEPFEGADALVYDAQRRVRVGCLSNTNSLHWSENVSRWAVLSAFDDLFLSFQMGCVKPDREIFDRVVDALERAPHRVLLLDDNATNVDGALAAGLRAMRADGVDQARHCLATFGLVPDG
jgi:putative hydrolase of the HAD superfamily